MIDLIIIVNHKVSEQQLHTHNVFPKVLLKFFSSDYVIVLYVSYEKATWYAPIKVPDSVVLKLLFSRKQSAFTTKDLPKRFTWVQSSCKESESFSRFSSLGESFESQEFFSTF